MVPCSALKAIDFFKNGAAPTISVGHNRFVQIGDPDTIQRIGDPDTTQRIGDPDTIQRIRQTFV